MSFETVDKTEADSFATVKGIAGIGTVLTIINHNVSTLWKESGKINGATNNAICALGVISIVLSFVIGLIHIVLASVSPNIKKNDAATPTISPLFLEQGETGKQKAVLSHPDSVTPLSTPLVPPLISTHEFPKWQTVANQVAMILAYVVLVINIPVSVIWT